VFNGVMHFKYTPHGWMVTGIYENKLFTWGRRINRIDRIGGILRVCGNFTHKPKHGFVVRPHKLMAKG